jgi:hypothetical protein
MSLTLGLWPVRPDIFSDESFSSWFFRLAAGHGLSSADLYPAALPGGRMFKLDLDRHASADLFENLQRKTTVPAARLAAATNGRWAPTLFGSDDGHSQISWLPAIGRSYGRSSFGQQICPDCLAEDETPYLRQIWRLSFVTSCAKHNRLLLDRCPSCGAPYHPLSAHPQTPFYQCQQCKFDARRDPAEASEDIDLAIQARLLRAVADGWTDLDGDGHIHSIPYFRIRWQLHRLLATGRHAEPLRQNLERYNSGGDLRSIPRIREIERLNPRCRRALVRATALVMEDWPHRFVAACRSVGIHARVFNRERDEIPFALWQAVSINLSNPLRAVSRADIVAARDILIGRGEKPTYRNLRALVRNRFIPYVDLVHPVDLEKTKHGMDRYWKLDGVDPEVRRAVRLAAHQQGENVAAWVEQALRNALAGRSEASDQL